MALPKAKTHFPAILLCVAATAGGLGALGSEKSNVSELESREALTRPLRLFPDNLYAISFPSNERGVIAGYFGTLLRSDDGGLTWNRQQLPVKELIRRTSFADSSHGWAVGHRGTILATRDGGETWTVQRESDGVNLRAVAAVDQNTAYAVGHESLLLRTNDGGLSWTQQDLHGYTGRDPPRLHGVVALGAERAIAVGEFGVVAVTFDGGERWQTASGGRGGTLTAIANGGGRTVTVGLDGVAFEIVWPSVDDSGQDRETPADSTDGSELPLPRLVRIDTQTEQHLFDVVLGADGSGFACGDRVLLRLEKDVFRAAEVHESLALDFEWLGGATLGPNGSLWAVGRAGLIAQGGDEDGPFKRALEWSEVGIGPDARNEESREVAAQ